MDGKNPSVKAFLYVRGANASPTLSRTCNISTSFGISSWIEDGVPLEKLVMGMPMYGRTWQLKDPNVHGIGAPATGTGPGNGGIMSYDDFVALSSANGVNVVYDNNTVSTYSYAGTNWIGCDNPTSITNKVKYAKDQGLGGYFFWALGLDRNWTLARAASLAWDGST
ncbi:hypothetical protein RJ640_009465 [Escallonia rubra]|uniref:GH18 domain-containing protein n=1 Tax=Escallonia rubra TaxID=112253 RepID=A0AA88RQM0_9ASTE|nr:hypothetical protein RJ640_009465 [Escallonia rubra]